MVLNLVLVFLTVIITRTSCTFIIDSYNDYDGELYRIPLIRQKSGLERLLATETNLTLIKNLLEQSGKADTDTQPLFKHFDTQYYGLVNIGKPGKTFKLIFDTTWSVSWVISVNCPKTSIPCAFRNRYDHTVSSTYKPDGRAFNISGTMLGYMSKDVFLVGQMNCTDQPFAEISKLPYQYSLTTTEGIVGLGLLGGSKPYYPFFYNFFAQNKLKSFVFSIYVNRDQTTQKGGSILFGGVDNKHKKGDFTVVDIQSDTYWKFQMDKVTVVISSKSTVEFCKSGCSSMADSSSNTIVGPPEDIKAINQLIGAEPFVLGRYLIPCNKEIKGPRFNFTIGGRPFQILGRDYVQKVSYSGFMMCLSAFEEADPASQSICDWRLGGAFLYQFYTAYDVANRKMMIADAA